MISLQRVSKGCVKFALKNGAMALSTVTRESFTQKPRSEAGKDGSKRSVDTLWSLFRGNG